MYMGYKDIARLGFSKSTIYRWFNSEDFPPMIRRNGFKVNKEKFRKWLEKQEETAYEY